MQLIAISFDGLSVKVTLALLGFCTSGPVLALVIILLTINGILGTSGTIIGSLFAGGSYAKLNGLADIIGS